MFQTEFQNLTADAALNLVVFYSFTAELETREVPSNETVFKQAFSFPLPIPHLPWQESLMAVNKTNLKTLHIGTAAPLSVCLRAHPRI